MTKNTRRLYRCWDQYACRLRNPSKQQQQQHKTSGAVIYQEKTSNIEKQTNKGNKTTKQQSAW